MNQHDPRVKYINLVTNQVHDLIDELYEALVDGDNDQVIRVLENIDRLLETILNSIKDV